MSDMQKVAFVVFLIISLAASALFLSGCSDMTDVYVSHSSGECVEVKSRNPDYTCGNLPETYSHVWVK